jgi:hypothetical protein
MTQATSIYFKLTLWQKKIGKIILNKDFDTIYEENDDEPPVPSEVVVNIPDPIVIRGAGNVTMYEYKFVFCQFVE